MDTVFSGLIAGACEAILVVTPQETLKTKLIHDKLSLQPKYKGLFHGIGQIWNQHGFGGVYKGKKYNLILNLIQAPFRQF